MLFQLAKIERVAVRFGFVQCRCFFGDYEIGWLVVTTTLTSIVSSSLTLVIMEEHEEDASNDDAS